MPDRPDLWTRRSPHERPPLSHLTAAIALPGAAEAAPRIHLSPGERLEDAYQGSSDDTVYDFVAVIAQSGQVEIGVRRVDSSVEFDCQATVESMQMVCEGVMTLGSDSARVRMVYDESSQELTWTPSFAGDTCYSTTLWTEVNRAWASEFGRTIALELLLRKHRVSGTHDYVFVYDNPTLTVDGIEVNSLWR
jgi:hypothetical protein